MKDLKITFVQDGKEQVREFDTLMDFMVHYEMSDDKKQVTTATNAAMQNTTFFFINLRAFKISPNQLKIKAT